MSHPDNFNDAAFDRRMGVGSEALVSVEAEIEQLEAVEKDLQEQLDRTGDRLGELYARQKELQE